MFNRCKYFSFCIKKGRKGGGKGIVFIILCLGILELYRSSLIVMLLCAVRWCEAAPPTSPTWTLHATPSPPGTHLFCAAYLVGWMYAYLYNTDVRICMVKSHCFRVFTGQPVQLGVFNVSAIILSEITPLLMSSYGYTLCTFKKINQSVCTIHCKMKY